MKEVRLLVTFVNRSGRRAPDTKRIGAALRAAAHLAWKMGTRKASPAGGQGPFRAPMSLEVAFCRGAEMARLNRRFRRRRGGTDVLAFKDGARDPETGLLGLGEVLCDYDRAHAEAGVRRCPIVAETALYAVHGLLHLLGFDDKVEEERVAMRRLEAQALGSVGLEPAGEEWRACLAVGHGGRRRVSRPGRLPGRPRRPPCEGGVNDRA